MSYNISTLLTRTLQPMPDAKFRVLGRIVPSCSLKLAASVAKKFSSPTPYKQKCIGQRDPSQLNKSKFKTRMARTWRQKLNKGMH